MILHRERQILRDVYNHTDEAIAYANSLFSEDIDYYAEEVNSLWSDKKDITKIIETLVNPDPGIIGESTVVARQLADVLVGCYDIENALRELEHKAHLLTDAIRDVKTLRITRVEETPMPTQT